MKRLALVACLVMGLASPIHAATYEIDSAHSSVEFKVRHLIGKVTGRFNSFSGSIDYEPGKPKEWKVKATIEAKSIDTNNEKRDDHLRNDDFFHVKKYPTLEFVSTKVLKAEKDSAKIRGNLTMHGVTKPVVLDVEILGTAVDPWGNEKAVFSATTKLNRKDFGLSWNKKLETGGLLVGDEIQIFLEVESNKKKSPDK